GTDAHGARYLAKILETLFQKHFSGHKKLLTKNGYRTLCIIIICRAKVFSLLKNYYFVHADMIPHPGGFVKREYWRNGAFLRDGKAGGRRARRFLYMFSGETRRVIIKLITEE
ncbi:MAG: hypothetical protein J6P98_08940, partial [Clostridia bacterium]|nr:hypothetical protein [Clostridia bacterium]